MDAMSLVELLQFVFENNLWSVFLLIGYHFSFIRPWINEIRAMNVGYQKLMDEKLGNIENSLKEIKTDFKEWRNKGG